MVPPCVVLLLRTFFILTTAIIASITIVENVLIAGGSAMIDLMLVGEDVEQEGTDKHNSGDPAKKEPEMERVRKEE